MTTNENLLMYLYYSPSVGATSIKKLYERVKERGITMQEVKDFISKQATNQVFKQMKRPHRYFPIVAKYKHEILQIDLVSIMLKLDIQKLETITR